MKDVVDLGANTGFKISGGRQEFELFLTIIPLIQILYFLIFEY